MQNQSDTNCNEPNTTIKLGIDPRAEWYYVARLNTHHPTPTGDSLAGGAKKHILCNRMPGGARRPGHRRER